MMGKLDAIIDKINTEKRFLLSVYDLETGTYLYKYYPATRIVEEFGSGENFFEELNSKGHKHLNINSHLKRGTGKSKDAPPITVNFADSTIPEEETDTKPIPMIPTVQTAQFQSANDVSSLFGLGAPQVMELMVKKHEADRLTLENSELRADNRSLKEQNEKYREELLKDKYDYQKEKEKKGDTHALIGQIAGSLPAIMQYIKPNGADGLNASQSIDYGSIVKNNFAGNLKQIDDDMLMILATILHNVNTNTDFSNELMELLKKHQLWQ